MKGFLGFLAFFLLASMAFAELPSAATPLDQTIPCPGGGNIDLSGTYVPLTSNINATLTFNNCVYKDERDTLTLNGTTNLTGTLPLVNGTLNLEMTSTDLKIEEQSIEDDITENFSSECSGNIVYTGTVTNGTVDTQHTSHLTCKYSGTSHMPISKFLDSILKAGY